MDQIGDLERRKKIISKLRMIDLDYSRNSI